MIWLLRGRGRGSNIALYCDTNKQRWFFLKQGLKFEFATPYCSPCVNLTNFELCLMHDIFQILHSVIYKYYIFSFCIFYIFSHVFIGTCFWYAVVYLVCFVFYNVGAVWGGNKPAWVALSYYTEATMLPYYGGR